MRHAFNDCMRNLKILFFSLCLALLFFSESKAQEQKLNSICCPKTKIIASSSTVKEGKTVTFTIKGIAPNPKDCKFNYRRWSVSGGKLVRGQNTKSIVVKANQGTGGDIITVTIEVNEGCENYPTQVVEVLKL